VTAAAEFHLRARLEAPRRSLRVHKDGNTIFILCVEDCLREFNRIINSVKIRVYVHGQVCPCESHLRQIGMSGKKKVMLAEKAAERITALKDQQQTVLPEDPITEAGRKVLLDQFTRMLEREAGSRTGENI